MYVYISFLSKQEFSTQTNDHISETSSNNKKTFWKLQQIKSYKNIYTYTIWTCIMWILFIVLHSKLKKAQRQTNGRNQQKKTKTGKNPYSISVLRLFAVVSTEEKRYETNRKSDFLVPYT